MDDKIREYHYPDVTFTNGVQDEPLFWDYVNKPVWDVSEKFPLYFIDVSRGFSFYVDKVVQANYTHVKQAQQNNGYCPSFIFFKERNDANRFIRKVKQATGLDLYHKKNKKT